MDGVVGPGGDPTGDLKGRVDAPALFPGTDAGLVEVLEEKTGGECSGLTWLIIVTLSQVLLTYDLTLCVLKNFSQVNLGGQLFKRAFVQEC